MHSSACQPWGDGDPADDSGLRNIAKRWMAKGTVTPLTVHQFQLLQSKTDSDAVAHKKTRDQLTLTGLVVDTNDLSEGDLVSVSGFLNRAQDGSKQETVNCKLLRHEGRRRHPYQYRTRAQR